VLPVGLNANWSAITVESIAGKSQFLTPNFSARRDRIDFHFYSVNHGLRRLIEISKQDMSWLDMQFNACKSCMFRCGPRHNKECADILLNGVSLIRRRTFKYLGILFEVGRKLKVSLAAKSFSGLSTTFMAVLVLPLLLWFDFIF